MRDRWRQWIARDLSTSATQTPTRCAGAGGLLVSSFLPNLGFRHQTELELKWGVHPDGEKRSHPWANQNGTTISVLIEGSLRVTFHIDGTTKEVTLRTKGDYLAFGPEVVHSWEAIGDTIVLSVRFPSVEVGSRAVAATIQEGKSVDSSLNGSKSGQGDPTCIETPWAERGEGARSPSDFAFRLRVSVKETRRLTGI